ncbi:hypothetical protein Fmac_005999 [Flemingia macrophylla]|uniref:Uncharacterized protein n=1 Tax=Flemingia macrophylla TaxID=520843 RepID=A0ABD1N9H3_9FABA
MKILFKPLLICNINLLYDNEICPLHRLGPRRNLNLQWIFHDHSELLFLRQIHISSYRNLPLKIQNQISHKVLQMKQRQIITRTNSSPYSKRHHLNLFGPSDIKPLIT